MMATTVVNPISPLAAEMRSERTSSGMLPILAGLNRAACPPMSASTTNIRVRLPSRIEAMPRAISSTSATLQPMMTLRLLKRSAR